MFLNDHALLKHVTSNFINFDSQIDLSPDLKLAPAFTFLPDVAKIEAGIFSSVKAIFNEGLDKVFSFCCKNTNLHSNNDLNSKSLDFSASFYVIALYMGTVS